MKKIVVASVIANKHRSAGAIWTSLSWTLGFRALGFDAYHVEQIAPESCVDAAGNSCSFEASANVPAFDRAIRAFGLQDKAALICGSGENTRGLGWSELLRLADEAEAIINISGHLEAQPLLERFRGEDDLSQP